MKTTLRIVVWALALVVAACGVPASAQVQLTASTGDVTWAARTRNATGKSVSILARVYIPPSATSGSVTIGVGATGGSRHAIVIGSDLALSVTTGNTAGSARTTTYSTTNTEGRWIWYAAYIPANTIGGGVGVTSSLWYDNNGSWTAASGAATGSDPGGTIGDTAGTVRVTNGTNADVVVGPLWIWADADSPDTAPEFLAIALNSTAPEAYTGLIFAATLRSDSTDTFGVDVTGTETSAAFVTHNGLPSWAGVYEHALVDIDPSRETTLGILSSIANRGLTGAAWTPPASTQGGEIVDNPYGVRAAYIGEDPSAVLPYCWAAPANGPIVHNRYSTIVLVGGFPAVTGSTAWNVFATGATDLQLQLLGHHRWGLNTNVTDAQDRVTSTPSVLVIRLSASPVEHWYNSFAYVQASFVCGTGTPTSGTMRLGAPTGSTTTSTRFWLQRLLVFEGNLSDTEVADIRDSLTGWHSCRNYTAGVSKIIVGEGTSSLAGTWDYRAKMGSLHRMAALAPRTTMVFNCATGGQTFTNHDEDRVNTVQYIAETLCPSAVKKTFIAQMGSNDLDIASPDAAAVTTSLTNYIAAVDPYYDRILVLKLAPRVALTASQANYNTAWTTFNANIPGIAGVNRYFDTFFTNCAAGGDFTNSTYYQSDQIHLNGAGHDLYMSTVWGGKARIELGASKRRRQLIGR